MIKNTKKRIAWNKGLTKETDKRVSAYSKTLKKVMKGRIVDWGDKISAGSKGSKRPWVKKNSPYKTGSKHIFWKGGRVQRKDGYIVIHSGTDKKGHSIYRKEHRIVMEKYLGRKLKVNETVHHKNGVKNDNKIENLEVVLRTAHRGKVNCPKCNYGFSIK